jgi:hypothetical protein
MALRPVRRAPLFGVFVFSGRSGGLGRAPNACCASAATTGGGSGDFSGRDVVLRCLRWAIAKSSASRSLSFAISVTSLAFVESNSAICARCSAFSRRSASTSIPSRRDHASRSRSIPYRPGSRRNQPRRAAVKSMPASSEANVAPSICTWDSALSMGGS